MRVCSQIAASLVAIILLGMGCSKTIHPQFEESNQLFVEETVKEIKLGETIKPHVPAGSKVALASMERSETLDQPLLAVIEDQLITSLLDAGYTIMERDSHALIDLLQERAHDTYSLYSSNPLAQTIARADRLEIEVSEIDYSDDPPYFLSPTNLAGADYLICYRILESGIIYRDKDSKFDTREGLVRLHVRIHNTSDGSILMANNLTGIKRDEVRKELVAQLAHFHYTYYPFEYPLQPREPVHPPNRAATTSNRFFFLEMAVGQGTVDDESEVANGLALGWGSPEFGRMGLNFSMIAETKTYNAMLQWERPLQFWVRPEFVWITPSIGAGYVGSDVLVQDFGYWKIKESSESFGIQLGGSVELDVSKTVYLKAGYTQFISLDDGDVNNGMLGATLGLRL